MLLIPRNLRGHIKQYLDKIPEQMQVLETLTKGTRRYKEMMELSETIAQGLQAIDKFRNGSNLSFTATRLSCYGPEGCTAH